MENVDVGCRFLDRMVVIHMTSYNKQSGALTVNLEITFQAKKTLTDVNLALIERPKVSCK